MALMALSTSSSKLGWQTGRRVICSRGGCNRAGGDKVLGTLAAQCVVAYIWWQWKANSRLSRMQWRRWWEDK